MKKIICYCSGGMGNRLRPLASCYQYAKETNRELVIFWENVVSNGCLAPWNSLFKNEIKQISIDELKEMDDCVNYFDYSLAEREQGRGLYALKRLSDRFPVLGRANIQLNYTNENVVFYCNNFMKLFTEEQNTKFLKQLEPIDSLQEKINWYTFELELNKNVYGIHARGTDFGVPLEYYINKIEDILNKNELQKFFLCSDDLAFENKLNDLYPNNIIRRIKDQYINKKDESLPWQNHNSFEITESKAQDGLIDMYLLSKTNIQVYHPNSTFTEIARMI